MRAYGSGTVEQTGSGQWRYTLPASATGGKRVRSKSMASQQEAEQALEAALQMLASGAVTHGALTLGEYWRTWYERTTHRSRKDDAGLWGRYLAGKSLAMMPMEDITPGHVRRFVDGLSRTRKQLPTEGKRGARRVVAQALSPQTVRHAFGLLRRVLGDARLDGHIPDNPCTAVKMPNIERKRVEEAPSFLSADEIEQLLTAEEVPQRFRLIYEVAIFTGLREGELWGLRWKDLDLDSRQPKCSATYSYGGPTKNTRVRRFVLLPRAAAALKRWRDIADYTKPEHFVFPGRNGEQHTKGYDAEWGGKGKYREAVGLRRELRFHDFRHTCASHLIMGTWGKRWQLHDVCKYLDHSSISVTERYAHLSPSHLADLAMQTVGE